MKVIAVLSLAAVALASVLEKRACAANNCIRAVTGTRLGDASVSAHRLDCSSFVRTTVTPAAVTHTITVDDTGATVVPRAEPLQYRQLTVVPSAVPAYASDCGGGGGFSSACSCWGITATVTTAATPTITVTSTLDYCDEDL